MADTSGSQRPPAAKVLGITAAADLVVGVVLSLVGLAQDSTPMTIVGVVLLLSGAGVLAFLITRRNEPQAL